MAQNKWVKWVNVVVTCHNRYKWTEITLHAAGFGVHLVARAESQYLDETVCSLRFAARAQKARGPSG